LDHQVSGHASGVASDENAASGVSVSPKKYIPPHLGPQVKPLGGYTGKTTHLQAKPPSGCPGETTPPSVTASGACLGETTPLSVTTPLVTTAYVRVTPKPDTQLEADESCQSITYVYGDREVKVWTTCDADDDEQTERDDIARNRIIWVRLNPAADWFFCRMSGERIQAGEIVPHGSRVLIRHRDEADHHWWHRAMIEMKKESEPKFTPPAHCLEDEDEEAVEED
jgi:hypothetical protein